MDSGTSTFKMFGCPVCGFRVSQVDSACPRCGNEFGERTKFECPFCGELVDPSMTTCPSCHVDYSDFRTRTEERGGDDAIDALLSEIIKIESQQAKTDSSSKRLSCPECAWLLEGTERKCPKCGADLRDEMSFQCPICGSTVAANAPSCPECGASFEEEPGAPPEPEDAMKTLSAVAELEPELDGVEEPPPPPPEPEPEPPRPPVIIVKPSIKKKGTAVVLPRVAEPPPAPEPEPQPAKEADIPDAKVAPQEPTDSKTQPPASAPAKKRTRKLKAKPGTNP